jgi:hypothetical protein
MTSQVAHTTEGILPNGAFTIRGRR